MWIWFRRCCYVRYEWTVITVEIPPNNAYIGCIKTAWISVLSYVQVHVLTKQRAYAISHTSSHTILPPCRVSSDTHYLMHHHHSHTLSHNYSLMHTSLACLVLSRASFSHTYFMLHTATRFMHHICFSLHVWFSCIVR